MRDLLAQPLALADTLAGLRVSPPLDWRSFERIILTGMGGSLHALHALNVRMTEEGRAPVMVETSELVHAQARLLEGPGLAIAVSQSGRSAEVLRLLELRRCAVLGVTNTADSPLARRADAVVLTQAGEEHTISCKTYVAALAALEWLGGGVGDVVPAMRAYLEQWREHVESLGALLDGVNHVFLAGRGASLAAAGTGGLIIKEAAHFHAEGMSSAAFRHGPLEMVRGDVFVLVFAGREAALNRKLAADVRAAGGRAEVVAADAELPVFRVAAEPMLEILPAQMMSVALALKAGHEPGRFVHASKVTVVE